MMRWLDTGRSDKEHPNENFSREMFELFVLGHGNYTEHDVREAARAFTGWRWRPATGFRVARREHDDGAKTILGQTADFGGEQVVRLAASRPAAQRWIASRVWSRFAAHAAPGDAAVTALLESAPPRPLSELFRAVLLSPQLTSATVRAALVKQPYEWVVGAQRALNTSASDKLVLTTLRSLGQIPFAPSSVGGWPEGAAWLSTSATQTRIQFATALVAQADLSPLSDEAPAARIDALANVLAVDGWGLYAERAGSCRGRSRPAGHPRPHQSGVPARMTHPLGPQDRHPAPPAHPPRVHRRQRRRRRGRSRRHRGLGFPLRFRGHARARVGAHLERRNVRPRHPLRRQRRSRHRRPGRRPGVPAGTRRPRDRRAGRVTPDGRPVPASRTGASQAPLRRRQRRDRARGRLPAAGSQPLPVDVHLADRLAPITGDVRLARPLAGCHPRVRCRPARRAHSSCGRRRHPHPGASRRPALGRGHPGGKRREPGRSRRRARDRHPQPVRPEAAPLRTATCCRRSPPSMPTTWPSRTSCRHCSPGTEPGPATRASCPARRTVAAGPTCPASCPSSPG